MGACAAERSAEWLTGRSGRTRTPTKLSEDIGKFTAWFNGQIAPATGHPVIPADDHGHIHPARLRRTLAWHIARQPFGVIAGARQYHHAKLVMFEGYAGTSASGFAQVILVRPHGLRPEEELPDGVPLIRHVQELPQLLRTA